MTQTKATPKALIMLTERQRKRVKEDTGRDIDRVEISDAHGDLTHRLPEMTPDEVDQIVFRKGKRDGEDEALAAELEQKARDDEALAQEQTEKAAQIAAEREKEALDFAAAIQTAFEIEGQAVEAAREAAKSALAAAKAAAAQQKKRR